jgi:osmoprotectant transport system permease protein
MSDALEKLLEAWSEASFWEETFLFLSMVLRGLGIALLVGIPVGILLTRSARFSAPIIAVLALLQTFPSLALLGLLIPWLGIGQKAAVFLAVVYCLFPIVMNTHVGITQVAPAIRDAALGMGMTPRQVLWNVDLPLALPVILAGVRTGAVYAIGIITVCALAGAGGLGLYILRGMARSDNFLIGEGAIPLLLITLLLFWGLGALAWVSRKNSNLGLVLGGGVIVLLSAYAVLEWVRPRADKARLASKNFVEGEILAEIQKQMLEAHTGLNVEVFPNLTPSVIFKAIVTSEIDLYPEYTGNLLTNKDALDMGVPADKSTITDLVREQMRKRFHLRVLAPFGLNNTYALCLPRPLARKHRLEKISDLRRFPEARVAVDLDFRDRPDGWQGLLKTYGLRLPKPQLFTPELRYKALLTKEVDLVCGFATDWEIEAYDLAVLEDDKGYFPNYHGVSLVREEVLRAHPEIAEVLGRLKGQIDDRTMRRLNYQVAQGKRSAAEVAREFLLHKGLLRPAGSPDAK